jgi:hypothetical protein
MTSTPSRWPGPPVEVLDKAVTNAHADLLVVGNVGLNTLTARILGSVPLGQHVDLTHVTKQVTGGDPRPSSQMTDLELSVAACLVADGCNLGLSPVIKSGDPVSPATGSGGSYQHSS